MAIRNALLIFLVSPLLLIAQTTISGSVSDEATGEPLLGVNVIVQGTSYGGTTDDDGNYSFTLPSDVVGEISVSAIYIGYAHSTARFSISGVPIQHDFSLVVDVLLLDEIVVTGTPSSTRRRELGNSIATLGVEEIIRKGDVTSVPDLLNGRVAGLVAMTGTGVLGAGPRLKLRGTASLALDDQPLIYVDGVRTNNAIGAGPNSQGYGAGVISRLGDFSADEIERIEIVKGPAAATLYGSEASNGVIQIFTKRGTPSAQARWDVSIGGGSSWLNDPYGEWGVGYDPSIWGPDPETGKIGSWNLFKMENDAGRPVFQTGNEQRYSVNVSGGSREIDYFVGGTYETGAGVYPTNDLWRFNGRTNIGFKPNKKWTIRSNLGFVKSYVNLADDIGSGPLLSGMYSFTSLLNTPNRGYLIAPPEWLYARTQNAQGLNRFTGSIELQFNPVQWFQNRLVLGLDETEEDNIVQRDYLGPEAVQFFGPTGALGSRSLGKNSISYLTVDYSGTARFELSDEIKSETSFGAQYFNREAHAALTSGNLFAAPGLQTVSSTAQRFAGETFVRNVTVGTFLQEKIAWRDRAFLTMAVRVDNNSAFGKDFTYAAYPKISGSWVVSEEPFFNISPVNSLKLRAAYGQTGQQPVSFSALRFYLPITTGTGDAGVKPESPGNSELAPEKGAELEIGFESAILKNRVSLDFSYYDQNIRDVLLQRQLAPSSGFPGTQWVNVGEISSRGVELGINTTPIITQNLSLNLGFHISSNKNTVVDLGGVMTGTTADGKDYLVLDIELDTGGLEMRHQEGLPPGAWFGWKMVSADLDADGNATNMMCDGGPGKNNQPTPCEDAPFVYLGPSTPLVEGAFNTSVTVFKNITLSALIDFKYGHNHGDNDAIVRCQLFGICRENHYPKEYDPLLVAQYQSGKYSDFAVADAGFTKLRSMSLSYEIPRTYLQSLGVTGARITLSAYNWLTWTDWPSLDPETYFTAPTSTNPLFDKSSQTFTPKPRQVRLTLRVRF
ncbi:MAG: SusC/RagA family TonB-linked outer membrane protein [SAR202 cluster bacterium]|jgi:TonB-linked SusC/RagA family outer membrane protein|nr:SusC/RagA family TonB-linked outer membrane protein [SAR202 cluster bacterium]